MTAPVKAPGDAFPLMQAGSTTVGQNNADDWAKIFFQGLIFNPGAGGFVRKGVLHRGWVVGTEPQELKVLEIANGPNVQINPGLFVVQRGDVSGTDRGVRFGGTLGTTPTQLNLPAAPGANSRYDAIFACVKDKNIAQDAADPVTSNGVYYDYRSGTVGAVLNINGTPGTAGAPPVTPDGYLLLAVIPRATNDNTIDQAGILDFRRGATITGTPRMMFPYDIANIGTDTGRYLGEERYRPAAGIFPAMLDRWDGTTWRGTFSSIALAQPAQTASGNLPANTAVSVASGLVTIPWPGVPYKIRGYAALLWGAAAGGARELVGEINLDSNVSYTPPSGGGNTPPASALGWTSSNLPNGGQTELIVTAPLSPAITDGLQHVLSFWIFAPPANSVIATVLLGYSYRFALEIVPA